MTAIVVSSEEKTVVIEPGQPVTVIGEKINPSRNKRLSKALAAGDMKYVQQLALSQVEAGAHILDINVGLPGSDQASLMNQAVLAVTEVTKVPLSLDSSDPSTLEAGLSVYKGQALVNSVTGEERSLSTVLPLVKRYDAAVIALTQDEQGIPSSATGRLDIAAKIIERATALGIDQDRILVDCAAMPAALGEAGPQFTLEAIELVTSKLGVNATVGASNASFGLPWRNTLNSIFIIMIVSRGATAIIMDPTVSENRIALLAVDLFLGRDRYASNFLAYYRRNKQDSTSGATSKGV